MSVSPVVVASTAIRKMECGTVGAGSAAMNLSMHIVGGAYSQGIYPAD